VTSERLAAVRIRVASLRKLESSRPECTVWMKLRSARASLENICMRRSAMKRWPR
jgi:hypothetical protein